MRMTKNELREIFDRLLRWPPEDQEKVARVVDQIDELGSGTDLSEEERHLIDGRELD
jgi:Tfp pilus assembly protein PilO